jgi:protein SSD1
VIDGKGLGDIPVLHEHDVAAIQSDIKILYDISKVLRERRYQSGALTTTSLRLSFKLDDKGKPEDCWQFEQSEGHKLVEEVSCTSLIFDYFCSSVHLKLMILTNIAVAEQTAVNFPEQALLRRHDTPIERRLVRIYHPPGSLILISVVFRKHLWNARRVSVTRSTSLRQDHS